jgi:hypothetical protein
MKKHNEKTINSCKLSPCYSISNNVIEKFTNEPAGINSELIPNIISEVFSENGLKTLMSNQTNMIIGIAIVVIIIILIFMLLGGGGGGRRRRRRRRDYDDY